MTFNAFLQWLLRASWQASVLAILVVIVQWTLARRMSARWKCALWSIVLLRLVLPAVPTSRFSLFNAFRFASSEPKAAPTPPEKPLLVTVPVDARPVEYRGPVADSTSPDQRAVQDPIPPRPPSQPYRAEAIWSLPWNSVLAITWLTVAGALALRLVIASLRLWLTVRRLEPLDDPYVAGLLENCRRAMGIRRSPALLTVSELASPALVGFWRPKLLLPRHVLDFDHRELRLILLHELAHLRRHDVLINWLTALLAILHWFNPILWLAFARMRSDRELACDEQVLAATNPQEWRSYGQTILKLLRAFSGRRAAPGMVGILEGMHHLRRRITMIAQFKTTGRLWTILALLLAGTLAAVALTDAAQPSDKKTDAAEKAGVRAVIPGGRMSGQNASANEEQKNIEEALKQKVPSAQFDSAPLKDVLNYFGDFTKLNLDVQWKAIEAAGITADSQISIRVKDIPAGQLLKMILREAGGERLLGWKIEGPVLQITTREVLDQDLAMRAYDVGDLLENPGKGGSEAKMTELIGLITETVSPESWATKGGKSTIKGFNAKLIVTTSDANHEQIAKLLKLLRDDSGEKRAMN